MQTFKKMLISAAVFLIAFTTFMCGLFHVCYNSDHLFYHDRNVRKELAGQLDCLICGSSHGLVAFRPDVIDPILGTNSYNLCGCQTTVSGMSDITRQELRRNPVKTVYVEVCFNTLTRDSSGEKGEGEAFTIQRLDGMFHRIGYFLKWGTFSNYKPLYSQLVKKSLETDIALLRGNNWHQGSLNFESRGYYPLYEDIRDMTIPPEEFDSLKDSITYYTKPLDSNLEPFEDMLKACEERGADIVFVVTPLSESFLWKTSNMDSVMELYKDYCAEHGYGYIDFNLLKDRRELFPEDGAFYDGQHLAKNKAECFSEKFAEVVLAIRSGESVDDMFFSSYEEMREALPYVPAQS